MRKETPTRRGLVAAAIGLAAAPAAAQPAWPNRPVRILVPYPPGSGTDIVGRVVAERLAAALGQPVVVENRAGAGGTLGTDAGAKAAPDGQTFLISDVGPLAMAPHLYARLPYDPLRDFAPVGLMARLPFVLAAHPSVPARDAAEFAALARTRPGAFAYASVGNGSATHLAMELFAQAADVQLTHVPYRGSAPALNDLVAGQVQVMFVNTASSADLIREGRLRGLAIGSREASPVLPGVPTLSRSLGREMEAGVWFGLLAPRGTEARIVERLSEELARALQDGGVRSRIEALGGEAAPSTPDAFGALVAAEVARWAPVVRSSGARID
ncbi:MAG: tripartite tricarboxylate transporter substrate binding protein [Acetobacteraceae bacterium]|nr:tripartite tricarboxylate transporter substrate binding protein [Acetobacteraceae bacterium]